LLHEGNTITDAASKLSIDYPATWHRTNKIISFKMRDTDIDYSVRDGEGDLPAMISNGKLSEFGTTVAGAVSKIEQAKNFNKFNLI
jgi:hypothetical protein